MGKNFFNGTDAQLNTGSAAFSAKITATPTAFGLVAAQATAYSTLNGLFNTAYLAAIDPITRTKGKVAAKNQTKVNLKAMASELAKIIQATPTVTDEQKIELGLNVRAHPTPNPPPSVRPAVSVIAVNGRAVTVNITDAAVPSKRGKPAGCLGANIYSFAGTTYPVDPTAWSFEGTSTKRQVTVQFADSVAGGSQVWIMATWFNRTTQSGPPSVPVSTFVQGGLSMAV